MDVDIYYAGATHTIHFPSTANVEIFEPRKIPRKKLIVK